MSVADTHSPPPLKWTDWPAGMRPGDTPLYAHNEITIAAPPAIVWAWLTRARLWPDWYSTCKSLRFVDGGGPDLELGTKIIWKVSGFQVRTAVQVLEAERRLAWDGVIPGITAFHTWLLKPAGGGTHVVTEETQSGWLASVGRWYLGWFVPRAHQDWLEALARMATTGPPPDPRTA